MKKSFKRIIATALATTLCAGVSSISASAYGNAASWNVYYNPYQIKDNQTLTLVTYGDGYRAKITGMSGEAYINEVYVDSESVDDGRRLNVLDNYAYFDFKQSSEKYVMFTVDFYWEGGTYVSNQGLVEIRV